METRIMWTFLISSFSGNNLIFLHIWVTNDIFLMLKDYFYFLSHVVTTLGHTYPLCAWLGLSQWVFFLSHESFHQLYNESNNMGDIKSLTFIPYTRSSKFSVDFLFCCLTNIAKTEYSFYRWTYVDIILLASKIYFIKFLFHDRFYA